jgi:hypothetical protein
MPTIQRKPQVPTPGLGLLPARIQRKLKPISIYATPETPSRKSYAGKTKVYAPGSTKNQGLTSECVSFSFGGLLAAEPFRRNISRNEIHKRYVRAQELDEWPGQEPDYYGTSLTGGFLSYQEAGYLPNQRPVEIHDTDSLIHWMAVRGPVILATAWNMGMAYPNKKTGQARPTGNLLGYHAYLGYGFSMNKSGTSGKIFFLNSHGLTYGLEGRGFITTSDLDILFRRDSYAFSVYENETQK